MAQVATEAAVQDSAVVASVDMVAEASVDLVARAATEVQDLAAEVRVVSAAWEAAQNLAVEALADTEA